MTARTSLVIISATLALLVGGAVPRSWAGPGHGVAQLEIAKVYFEYNSSANDLGVHVSLDGEDWKQLRIVNPKGRMIFKVEGKQAYKTLGMTELFFEGAEPSLDDFPLEDLLALFPEGDYKLSGKTVDEGDIKGTATLSHAIPAGPSNVAAVLGPGNSLVISWDAVTAPPAGFPDEPIQIVGYQVIVDPFQVTVPGTTTSLTVSPEFVASLGSYFSPSLMNVLAVCDVAEAPMFVNEVARSL